MATTVVKTIGTGGDYTTLQAWEDACPASLVGVDQIWQGQCKNQEFTSTTTLLTVSGTTVDATRYVELTTQAGASFIDNASAATNALRYNAANGAAIRITAGYAAAINVSQNYTRINKLQIASSYSGAGAAAAVQVGIGGSTNSDVNQCIMESYSLGIAGTFASADINTIRNSLIVQKNTSASVSISKLWNGTKAYNCTFVSLGVTLTTGVNHQYVTSIMTNCYVGNATAPSNGTITKTNCFASGTGTGYTVAPFSTATFQNITDTTHDFRLKAGSGLLNVGVDDATNAATDILGTARAASSYDVGAYELASSGVTMTMSWTEGSETVAIGANVAISGVTVAASWTEGSEVVAVVGNASSGTGTITTPVMKNNTGTILANETGVIVNVYSATTGVLVVRKTGQTSSAGGIVTVVDALIIPATLYAYEVILTANGRRLPTATAA